MDILCGIPGILYGIFIAMSLVTNKILYLDGSEFWGNPSCYFIKIQVGEICYYPPFMQMIDDQPMADWYTREI